MCVSHVKCAIYVSIIAQNCFRKFLKKTYVGSCGILNVNLLKVCMILTSDSGQLEILIHWVVQIFQILTYLILCYQATTFVNTLPISSKESLSVWKLSRSQWWGNFYKILILFSWKLNDIKDNKYYQLFSLNWSLHFLYFWENIHQIPKSK